MSFLFLFQTQWQERRTQSKEDTFHVRIQLATVEALRESFFGLFSSLVHSSGRETKYAPHHNEKHGSMHCQFYVRWVLGFSTLHCPEKYLQMICVIQHLQQIQAISRKRPRSDLSHHFHRFQTVWGCLVKFWNYEESTGILKKKIFITENLFNPGPTSARESCGFSKTFQDQYLHILIRPRHDRVFSFLPRFWRTKTISMIEDFIYIFLFRQRLDSFSI